MTKRKHLIYLTEQIGESESYEKNNNFDNQLFICPTIFVMV